MTSPHLIAASQSTRTEAEVRAKRASHTPGPWSIRDARGLLKGEKESASHPLHDAEVESNARLIAAAPELLEALGTAIGLITKHGLAVTLADLHPMDYARLERARAAITRATGEA